MSTYTKLSFLLLLSMGASQAPAWAHAALDTATPARNAQLTSAPKEISLHFNEKLEGNFSSIKLIDATGKNVLPKKAMVDATDPKTLSAPLDSLKPGRYTVQWVGVGHDGHRRTGDYKFSLK